MGIKLTTQQAKVTASFDILEKRARTIVIRNLQYCGEMCVKQARDWSVQSNPYKDQTGNLRSSVGYVVVADGRIVKKSSFDEVKAGAGDGAAKGADIARKVARGYTKGFCLIVVAGMEYAVFVADKGFDVLDSAELVARNIISQLMGRGA